MPTNTDTEKLLLIDICWEDILFPKILQLLSLPDLFNLRCCSADWKRLIEEFFKKYIHTVDSLRFHSQVSLRVLLQHCCRVTSVRLQQIAWLTNQDVLPFFANNRNLQRLIINDCRGLTDASLKPIIYNCKQLKTLHLSDCDWVTEGCLDCFMQHHHTLDNLYLEGFIALSSQCISNLCYQYNCSETTADMNWLMIRNNNGHDSLPAMP